jgi:hypothetical protein
MKARLVRLEKRLEKPFVRGTNLTLEKKKGSSEFCLARLNSIQIDRFPEQTEKEFVEMVHGIAFQ